MNQSRGNDQMKRPLPRANGPGSVRRLLKFALLSGLGAGIVCSQSGQIESRASAQAAAPSAEQQEFFEKKIRPILASSCQRCHNAKARVAGLDLTTAEGFLRGGDGGPVISKENPEASRLLKVVSYDGELKMPPSGKLKDEDIAALTA